MPPVESNQTERKKEEEKNICYLQYIHKVQGGTSNIMLLRFFPPKKTTNQQTKKQKQRIIVLTSCF